MISYTLNQLQLLRKARTGRDPPGQRILLLQLPVLCRDLSSEGVGGWFLGLSRLELINGEGKPPHPQHQTPFFHKMFLQTVLSAPEMSSVSDKAAGELFLFQSLV